MIFQIHYIVHNLCFYGAYHNYRYNKHRFEKYCKYCHQDQNLCGACVKIFRLNNICTRICVFNADKLLSMYLIPFRFFVNVRPFWGNISYENYNILHILKHRAFQILYYTVNKVLTYYATCNYKVI